METVRGINRCRLRWRLQRVLDGPVGQHHGEGIDAGAPASGEAGRVGLVAEGVGKYQQAAPGVFERNHWLRDTSALHGVRGFGHDLSS